MSQLINNYTLYRVVLQRKWGVQRSDNQEHRNGLTIRNLETQNGKNETHRAIHCLMKSVLQYRMLLGAKKK
jgi:hypothetical protein